MKKSLVLLVAVFGLLSACGQVGSGVSSNPASIASVPVQIGTSSKLVFSMPSTFSLIQDDSQFAASYVSYTNMTQDVMASVANGDISPFTATEHTIDFSLNKDGHFLPYTLYDGYSLDGTGPQETVEITACGKPAYYRSSATSNIDYKVFILNLEGASTYTEIRFISNGDAENWKLESVLDFLETCPDNYDTHPNDATIITTLTSPAS